MLMMVLRFSFVSPSVSRITEEIPQRSMNGLKGQRTKMSNSECQHNEPLKLTRCSST
jgi:hypothetical protein